MINKQAASGFKPETVLKALLNRYKDGKITTTIRKGKTHNLVDDFNKIDKAYTGVSNRHESYYNEFADTMDILRDKVPSARNEKINEILRSKRKELNIGKSSLNHGTYAMVESPDFAHYYHKGVHRQGMIDASGYFISPNAANVLLNEFLSKSKRHASGRLEDLAVNSKTTNEELASTLKRIVMAGEHQDEVKKFEKALKVVNNPNYAGYVDRRNKEMATKLLKDKFKLDIDEILR